MFLVKWPLIAQQKTKMLWNFINIEWLTIESDIFSQINLNNSNFDRVLNLRSAMAPSLCEFKYPEFVNLSWAHEFYCLETRLLNLSPALRPWFDVVPLSVWPLTFAPCRSGLLMLCFRLLAVVSLKFHSSMWK